MNVSAISSISRLGLNSANSIQGSTATRGLDAGSSIGSTTANAVDGTNGDAAPGTSFANSLGEAFANLNGQLGAADASMADFAAGGNADLHTVMLQMEEASISLKLGVQVRDKLLEAYQEIMRTQL